MLKKNRAIGFAVILLIYLVAGLLGVMVYGLAEPLNNVFLQVLIADVAATVFVYLTGVILQNASTYDPYWSVAPIVILPLLMLISQSFSLPVLLLVGVITFWGLRLTFNWAGTFTNLSEQDWRYDMLKAKFGKLFQLISFLGINLFPTLVVFGVICPAIAVILNAAALSHLSVNLLTVLGLLMSLSAVMIQLVTDRQLHEFRRTNKQKGKIIDIGLWKYSRHPNYFGEILMWWGVYVVLVSLFPNLWLFGIGAFVNNLMFMFISIPMAEKKLASTKKNFAEYQRTTSVLIPWPRRKLAEKDESTEASHS